MEYFLFWLSKHIHMTKQMIRMTYSTLLYTKSCFSMEKWVDAHTKTRQYEDEIQFIFEWCTPRNALPNNSSACWILDLQFSSEVVVV